MNEKDIKWIELNEDKIALRKGYDGWRVVHPFKNQDGTKNIKNILVFGSWWNILKYLAILSMILLYFYVYAHDTAVCRETVQRDIQWFKNVSREINSLNYSVPSINFSLMPNKKSDVNDT